MITEYIYLLDRWMAYNDEGEWLGEGKTQAEAIADAEANR